MSGGRPGIVDCDVHNPVPGADALLPHLPAHWVDHITNSRFKGPVDVWYPRRGGTTSMGSRLDASAGAATVAGWDAGAADRAGIELAILNCPYAVDSLHNPEQADALARAVNDWQVAEWLERDPRLRASIVVPSQVPALAVREIDRVADHPGFVQVLLPARSAHPYGHQLHLPLWEAIARHGLVAGIHHGGASGSPTTPVGWPSYHFEEHVAMAGVFASQVASIVAEGVLDRFPSLRVTLIESGVTWLPAHLWRLDKEWQNLRRVVPWVKRPPSDYVRDHFRLTTAPLDGPEGSPHLADVLAELGGERMLLHGSGYPDVAAHLRDGGRGAALRENAFRWYRLRPSRDGRDV